MKFDIQIMDSAMLDYLKDPKFIQDNINKFSNYESNDWVTATCPYSPFIDTKYKNVGDITLDMTAEKGKEFLTEFNNVKSVYSALKFLSDSTASEERLWAALCLGPLYPYVQYRWGKSLQSVNGIRQHFFFEGANRRSLTRNAAARLWWIGRLTYDEKRDNHFELTEFVCAHPDYIMHFIERNTSNNLHIMRPFLEAILEEEKNGIILNTDDGGELAKYLNLLGGMYVLDVMPEDWIKEKIIQKIHQIAQRGLKPAEQSPSSTQENESKPLVGKVAGKKIKSGSIVIVECKDDGKRMELQPKKMKFRTIPKSIIGLKVNDEITIMKKRYTIIEIK